MTLSISVSYFSPWVGLGPRAIWVLKCKLLQVSQWSRASRHQGQQPHPSSMDVTATPVTCGCWLLPRHPRRAQHGQCTRHQSTCRSCHFWIATLTKLLQPTFSMAYLRIPDRFRPSVSPLQSWFQPPIIADQ